jgi:hypothetical protein
MILTGISAPLAASRYTPLSLLATASNLELLLDDNFGSPKFIKAEKLMYDLLTTHDA